MRFLIVILFLCSAWTHAQTVNGVDIAELNADYIQIVGTSKLLSTKINVRLVFGQETKFFSGKKVTDIIDENGKRVSFNSMIDALNFMSKHGYEYKDAYVLTVSNQNVYHYIMQKRK